jgi:CheY-like chemotaxis protein
LAISKQLVGAMGGVLAVESVEHQGSTFSFSIALGLSPQITAIAAPDDIGTLDGRVALVVDDNSTNRRILRLQLEGWGMKVTDATDGVAACALVDSGGHFDVALVDVKMPRMSGEELAVRLRAVPATSRIPLILLSRRSDRPQIEQPELFFAVLTKPLRATRLKEILADSLAGVAPDPRLTPKIDSSKRAVSMRLLLAEDNPVNQRVGRLLLEKLGHLVDVAGNGLEAVDAVALVPYDAVFMDIQMPEMDGLDATTIIRSTLPVHRQPYIVALTASALIEDHQACVDAGMDDFLTKPARLEDYRSALARAQAHIKSGSTVPALRV